jgi:branched-chain amino acid transport system substrate-binding protein
MIRRSVAVAVIVTLCVGIAAYSARAERKYGPGVSDTEIKIGQTMPYSGPLSTVSTIGKVESAYFQMINDKGGIGGRRVTFISLDDGYSPAKTLEQTRRLIEHDEVLAIIGSFGTPTNAATQQYLNTRGVPQLFIQAGASRWDDPAHFPWTMPFVNLLRSEAKVYASYILSASPQARVAVLYQNDDFGRDYLDGLREKLGALAGRTVVAAASYETSDATVDSQMVTLQSSGADTLLVAAGPKFAAQAIRKAFDVGWHPTVFVAQVSSSPAVLKLAGLDKAAGVITATSFKSVADPQWEGDPEYSEWLSFLRAYYPQGDVNDAFTLVGYSNAVLSADVLRRCGDDLTRENLMAVATHLQGVRLPSLLPGITLNTSPTDYNFDGHQWVLFTEIIQD